jgi:hypothetical protein
MIQFLKIFTFKIGYLIVFIFHSRRVPSNRKKTLSQHHQKSQQQLRQK